MQKWLIKTPYNLSRSCRGFCTLQLCLLPLVHFSSKMWRKDRSNWATLNCFALEHTRTPCARRCPACHVGPEVRARGGRPASSVPASCRGSYVWRIVGRGQCHAAFPRSPTPAPPSSIGPSAAARRRPSHPTSSRRTMLHTATLLPWRARNIVTMTCPAIKPCRASPPRACATAVSIATAPLSSSLSLQPEPVDPP
jgi:hypothetical protein